MFPTYQVQCKTIIIISWSLVKFKIVVGYNHAKKVLVEFKFFSELLYFGNQRVLDRSFEKKYIAEKITSIIPILRLYLKFERSC